MLYYGYMYDVIVIGAGVVGSFIARNLSCYRLKTLVLEKDLVFYKIDEENKKVVVYAVVDQRQDYINIIRGL